MALGALLPFSIIMWTTGATAQSKTLQVCDEEGSFHLLSASSSSFKGNLDVDLDQIPHLIHD